MFILTNVVIALSHGYGPTTAYLQLFNRSEQYKQYSNNEISIDMTHHLEDDLSMNDKH